MHKISYYKGSILKKDPTTVLLVKDYHILNEKLYNVSTGKGMWASTAFIAGSDGNCVKLPR